MYSPQLLDHFEHPRNAGQVENADASVQVENPVCGDVLELSLRVVDERIEEIRFRAKGCVPTMACGSAVAEMAQGKRVEEVRAIGKDDVIQVVGGLPAASSHAAQLAVDALRSALGKLR